LCTAAVAALSLTGGAALADGGKGREIDTRADYTPGEEFQPLASSSPCNGEPSGKQAKPFVLPAGYGQQVLAEEGEGGSTDLWDMNTQNESGKDAGRYVYRTHEVGAGSAVGGGSQVTVTDLKTGVTKILAQRSDWERFDGIVWSPWGTLIAAEETRAQNGKDPQVPQAVGGLVYEYFVDPQHPDRLLPSREPITPGDGTTDTVQDGVRARPAVGAKSHEGMRFDGRGFFYGISESTGSQPGLSGAIFRFTPDSTKRNERTLAFGQLQAYDSPNGHDGQGSWITLDPTRTQVDADKEAEDVGANEYERPEDVETGVSTGKDANNGGHTLYVAMTGTDEVLALDLSRSEAPFGYHYVSTGAHLGAPTAPANAPALEFDSPDNLALDGKGNLAITEDPGGVPPAKMKGDDIWIAAPPASDDGDGESEARLPASAVERFASIKDCIAEPTGIYFAMAGTERFIKKDLKGLVTDETLFVNRQHAGQTSPIDQLIAINPHDDDDEGADDDGEEDEG